MKNIFSVIKSCRTCSSKNIDVIKNMNSVAIASPNTGMTDGVYEDISNDTLIPLSISICKDCLNLQINETVKPEILYRNFKYTTSITHGLVKHFEIFAKEKFQNNEVEVDDLVLDIGSNDGSLLKPFKNLGCKVLGIEPAIKLAQKVTEEGIETLPEFFTYELSKNILLKYGYPKIIVCNNTLANIDNLEDFIKGLKNLSNKKTIIYIETQYGIDVLEKMLIDTVYHEHLNYFTIHSLDKLFLRFGLYINDVSHLDNKGGSIRLKISNLENKENILDKYKSENLNNINFLIEMINKKIDSCGRDINNFTNNIYPNEKIYLFGSAVSCISLANQLKFDLGKIEAIVDQNPLTKNCYINGNRIRVIHFNKIQNSTNAIILNLAYRYGQIIYNKNKSFFAKNKFINVFPEVKSLN